MRMRLFVTILAMLVVGVLAAPATSTAAPTLTLTRDCSAYPPFHEFSFSLSGLPPNTPFFPTLSYNGTTIGPATGFSTDAAGSYTLAGLGSSEPATFTLTIDWAGGTLVQSLYVNCALPTSRHDCESGGWSKFPVFKNQGDCVSFIATRGKNPPAAGP